MIYVHVHCLKKCPYSEFFWSIFSLHAEKCGQENSEYGHFSRSGVQYRGVFRTQMPLSQMFDRVPEHASAVKTWNKICIIFRFLRLVRKMKWEKSFRKCKSMFKNNNKNTELLCWIYSKLIMKTPLVSLLSALIDFMPLVFFYISWKVFFSGYRKRTVAWNQ